MKTRKILFNSLLCSGALLFASALAAGDLPIQAALQERMDQIERDPGRVTDKPGRPDAGHEEHLNIIINLDPGEFANPARFFGQRQGRGQRAALRADITRRQQDALAAMPARAAAKVTYEFHAQHALAATLTPEEIRRVARMDSVVGVEEQPVAYTMSDESHPLTNTDAVHASGYTGEGSAIAVIDDGIESSHPAFGGESGFPTSKVIGGYDFADNNSDPRIDCLDQSHGTAVAGVAAGDGGGVTGTAPDARIVFLKIQSASICGQPSLDGNIIGAIDWVVANQETYDIDLINMSLGGGSFASVCDGSSTAYANAVNAAASAGIAIIAASGNEGLCDELSRPACLSNVISVGATYDADLGSSGSCVSANSCADTQPHSACPTGMEACFDDAQTDGVTCYSNSASFLDILAPSNCATTAATGGGVNDCFSGTSSSSPFAAGVAATLIEAAGGSGSLSPDEMRDLLGENGVSVTDDKNNRTTPRVDTLASFNALDADGDPDPDPEPGDELENGVPLTDLSGDTGSETFYTVEIPEGATDLEITTTGGSGDVDLYVKYASPPTTSDWDCRPYQWGNEETCSFESPDSGTWHVMLHGYEAYAGVTLEANWDEPDGGGDAGDLENGAPLTDLSGDTGSETFYTVEIPEGATDLEITTTGGSGDVDLYVKYASPPTTSDWDCRPYQWGNEEACSFESPDSGTWHVMLHGYEAYAGVTLEASWTEPGDSGGLGNGEPLTDLAGPEGGEDFFEVNLPAGVSSLEISTSGGSGDVDLYVKFGSPPATDDWDCRPWQWGNNETCTFDTPQAGTWHIMLHGYEAYSGVTLEASWD